MGYLQKKENRNAADARNSFVTRKAEQKLSALADIFKLAAEHHYVDERRDTLQRTLNFKDFRYLDNLKFVYNWENRFFSVNYNLQILSYFDVTEQFKEIGPCKFQMKFSMKRHQNDHFECKGWNADLKTREKYLERLNNPLIIDRVHKLDIHDVTITHKPSWGYFRVSVESMVGSGAWIFIPPIMQLITPKDEECVRFFELFELIGDALVNNSVEEENVETD
jgi:hypothetical protein